MNWTCFYCCCMCSVRGMSNGTLLLFNIVKRKGRNTIWWQYAVRSEGRMNECFANCGPRMWCWIMGIENILYRMKIEHRFNLVSLSDACSLSPLFRLTSGLWLRAIHECNECIRVYVRKNYIQQREGEKTNNLMYESYHTFANELDSKISQTHQRSRYSFTSNLSFRILWNWLVR